MRKDRGRIVVGVLALFTAAALIGIVACVDQRPASAEAASEPAKLQGGLTTAEITKILGQAEDVSNREMSLLRVDASGKKRPCKMHIVVVDRSGRIVGQRSQADAWTGSIYIARSKAYTALAFSSDENALTTRTIGALSQPGGPLWQIGNSNRQDGIIEFPGGVPLYKNAKLVGAIGVSGDGVEQDENVAEGGAMGFGAPKAIRADTVAGAPYTK